VTSFSSSSLRLSDLSLFSANPSADCTFRGSTGDLGTTVSRRIVREITKQVSVVVPVLNDLSLD
jgi:hypothetical protein